MSAPERNVTMVPVDQIRRHPKARSLNAEQLADLKESIARLGLINPIHVRRAVDADGSVIWDRYEIVSGHHRFAACGLLEWREVSCFIGVQDDIRAEMEMIAENLHRAELSKLERDEQIARWVELSSQKPGVDDDFEDFYAAVTENDPRAGNLEPPKPSERVLAQVAPKPHLQSSQVGTIESKREDGRGHRPESGVNAAARDLGLSKNDAHRAVKVASLSDEAKAVAREIGLDDNRTALLEAAKHDTPEAQVKALQERRQGGIAGRIVPAGDPAPAVPTFDDVRSALETLCRLSAEDFRRVCPPAKRPAMHQRMDRLIIVFEQVKEGVSQ